LQLNVTAEVRDLFQYIERYKAQEVELETPLKCFIPDYIPAIGELDAFIKVLIAILSLLHQVED
jgi:intraflagellar transport protein 46